MIRNYVLYEIDGGALEQIDLHTGTKLNTSLDECSKIAVGRMKPTIRSLRELASNEEVIFESKKGDSYEFEVKANFRTRKMQASQMAPMVQTSFRISLYKTMNTVISFDAGRKLSTLGTLLLSYGLGENVTIIRRLKTLKNDFEELSNWITKNGGFVKRITFGDIETRDLKYKQIILRAEHLEESKLFPELISSSKAISNITFTTPLLKSTGRSLTCRLNEWGGLTVYTKDPLEHEIVEIGTLISRISSGYDK